MWRLACVLALALAGTAAADAPPVTAELLADVAAVTAGRPFRVGVRLDVPAGWHVYWKNPGDAGLPTTLSLALPPGFDAGEVAWPLPSRFEQPGAVVGYGYGGELLLAVPVTPPAGLDAGTPVTVHAEIGWLACADRCIRGKAARDLRLPVADPTPSAARALFDAWAERLPLDAGAAGSPAAVTTSGRLPATGRGTLEIRLDWRAPPPALEVFPAADRSLAVDDVAVDAGGARVTLGAHRLAGEPPAPELETLLVYTDSSGTRRGLRVRHAL